MCQEAKYRTNTDWESRLEVGTKLISYDREKWENLVWFWQLRN